MSLPDCIDLTLCVRLMQTLGHFLWQGVAVFLLLWLATFLMRQSSASTRYAVSLLALLLMALCPAITFIFMGPENEIPTVVPGPSLDQLIIPDSEIFTASDAELSSPPIDWKRYAPSVAMGYLLGVVVMLGRVLLALQGGRRLRFRSEPVDDPRLLVALARQTKVLGLSFIPEIAYCRHVVVPTVVGVLRPMILFPISMSMGLSTEQIEVLLAHELAHMRRYDHLVNILQRLIEALLFFHPCVWLISRRIRLERENCCDDLVLAEGVESVTYADTLCQMAEIILTSHSGYSLDEAAALGAADRSPKLQQRILRIIENPSYKPVHLASGPHVAMILVGLATTLAVFQLIASGSPEDMIDLTAKSIVDGNVYILGQVGQPGAYPISEGEQLTMMELINAAGGYDGDEIEQTTVTFSRYQADGGRSLVHKLKLITLIENEGEDVFLRDGDLVTLSGEQFYRPQYYTRLVVGADCMTFEGQDVTLDELPELLQAVSSRPYTMISIAIAEEAPPAEAQFDAALRKVDEIVDKYSFEGRVLYAPRPLGDRAGYVYYLPIESMHSASGKVIPVNDSLLKTHTSDPPGRFQPAVRLVVGADRMTFQGRDATWDTLPAMLQAVPDRDRTFFTIAIASESPPGDKFYDAKKRAGELRQQFGFKRLRQGRRSKPLGSVGSLTYYVASEDTKRTP